MMFVLVDSSWGAQTRRPADLQSERTFILLVSIILYKLRIILSYYTLVMHNIIMCILSIHILL